MNSEQISSLVRQIALFLGGFVVAKGWIDGQTMMAIAGALGAGVASYFAFWTRTDKALVQSAAAKVEVPVSEQVKVGISEPVTPK